MRNCNRKLKLLCAEAIAFADTSWQKRLCQEVTWRNPCSSKQKRSGAFWNRELLKGALCETKKFAEAITLETKPSFLTFPVLYVSAQLHIFPHIVFHAHKYLKPFSRLSGFKSLWFP